MTLFNKILTKNLESSKSYSQELRKAVKCAQSTISRYKNEPNAEADSFQGMLDIIRYMDADKEQEIIIDYSYHVNPNRQTARYMLEYFSCNRMLKEMDSLLSRMEKEATNKQSLEFVKVYRLQFRRQTQDITSDESLSKIENMKITDQALKVFVNIIKCYCYYEKEYHLQALELTYLIKEEVSEIKERYLQNTFMAKFHEISSYISLWIHNDFDKAEEHANKVLNSELGFSYRGYAYFIIGYSQFFKNYSKAKDSLEKSLSVYEMIGLDSGIKNTEDAIEYLDAFHSKRASSNDYKSHIKYYDIALRQDELPKEFELKKEEIGEDYYYLIKGMSENNTEFLMLSMIKYIKTGNAFFANFPRHELQKRGYNNMILDELHKISR